MTTETPPKTLELAVTKNAEGGLDVHVGPALEAAMVDLFKNPHLKRLNEERAAAAYAGKEGPKR